MQTLEFFLTHTENNPSLLANFTNMLHVGNHLCKRKPAEAARSCYTLKALLTAGQVTF